jgi:hypothetical protein
LVIDQDEERKEELMEGPTNLEEWLDKEKCRLLVMENDLGFNNFVQNFAKTVIKKPT